MKLECSRFVLWLEMYALWPLFDRTNNNKRSIRFASKCIGSAQEENSPSETDRWLLFIRFVQVSFLCDLAIGEKWWNFQSWLGRMLNSDEWKMHSDSFYLLMIVIMMMIICYGGPSLVLRGGFLAFLAPTISENTCCLPRNRRIMMLAKKKIKIKIHKEAQVGETGGGKMGGAKVAIFFPWYWPLFFTHTKNRWFF